MVGRATGDRIQIFSARVLRGSGESGRRRTDSASLDRLHKAMRVAAAEFPGAEISPKRESFRVAFVKHRRGTQGIGPCYLSCYSKVFRTSPEYLRGQKGAPPHVLLVRDGDVPVPAAAIEFLSPRFAQELVGELSRSSARRIDDQMFCFFRLSDVDASTRDALREECRRRFAA